MKPQTLCVSAPKPACSGKRILPLMETFGHDAGPTPPGAQRDFGFLPTQAT